MGVRERVTMNSITFLVIFSVGFSQSFRLDSRIPVSRIPNSCNTQSGSSCVFPFKYKGVEYTQCSYVESPVPWCATMTASQGTVVTGRWGDCQISSTSSCSAPALSLTSCTTSSGPQTGQSCVFPFRYSGVVYTSCTAVDRAAAWCATSVDQAGEFQDNQYGFCPSSCPVTGTTTSTTTTTTTTTSPVTPTTTTTTTTSTGSSSSTTTSTTSTTAVCSTSSGPASGQECVFPFTYNGVTHNNCADWLYGGQPAGTTWCSTKVDSSGVHVNNEGNYGFCPASPE